jgi:hypothetical protein
VAFRHCVGVKAAASSATGGDKALVAACVEMASLTAVILTGWQLLVAAAALPAITPLLLTGGA